MLLIWQRRKFITPIFIIVMEIFFFHYFIGPSLSSDSGSHLRANYCHHSPLHLALHHHRLLQHCHHSCASWRSDTSSLVWLLGFCSENNHVNNHVALIQQYMCNNTERWHKEEGCVRGKLQQRGFRIYYISSNRIISQPWSWTYNSLSIK